MEDREDWFPIIYQGIVMEETDCDETFLSLYDGPDSLNYDGGIYLTEGLHIYPDGSIIDHSYDDEEDL